MKKNKKTLFVLTLFCFVVGCQQNNKDLIMDCSDEDISYMEQFEAPSSWSKVSTLDYTLSIPFTMEQASDDDLFRIFTGNTNAMKNAIIFQQKGLGKSSLDSVDNHYCRIIIRIQYAEHGDYPARGEVVPLDDDVRSVLRQRVDNELCGCPLVYGPNYRWWDINGTKVLDVNYVRKGNKGNTTNCHIYYLFDDYRFVDIIVSYREQEESLWLPDITNVIKTFCWK